MKFKKLAGMAASVLMACAMMVPLAACGGGGDTSGPAEENPVDVAPVVDTSNIKQITMWVGTGEWSGTNLMNLNKFVNAYNAVKPDGFTVKVTPVPDLEKSFQSSLTNGKQPEMMLWDRFNTATNGNKGYLYPIDGRIARDNVDTSVFYKPAMEEMTYGGATYGLPVDVDVWGTYVNMRYVEEYDAAHPDAPIASKLNANWTWDDLYDAAVALKTVCKTGGYSAGDQEQHLFKYYVSTGHGDEYLLPANDGVKGKYVTNFDNQWTKDILSFFKKVKDAGVGGTQEDTSFTSEILAMVNKPLYYNNQIKMSKVNNYKFLPQPKQPNNPDAVNGGMVGGYSIAFPAPAKEYQTKAWQAKHEAAWKFAKWLTLNKENMLQWSKDVGSLPALTEALDAPECVEGNQVLTDARSYIKATDTAGEFAYITRPQVPNYLTLQTDVINTQVPLFLNGGSVESCINALTTNGNSKLALGLS